MSTSDSALTALTLGVDVEELYILLAEGAQALGNGLPPGTYEDAERKVERSRAALLDGGFAHDVVRRFEDIVATFRPSRQGLPTNAFLHETTVAADRLGGLMTELRAGFSTSDAKAFDVGVMAARLHLCLRIVVGDTGEERRLIYLKELHRTVPILQTMLQAVATDQELRPLDPAIREHLGRLEVTLERYDDSAEWRRQAMTRADAVFSTVGMTGSGPRLENASLDSPADTQPLVDELTGYRQKLQGIAMQGDPAVAERGQRILIEDCRKALGPDHAVTIAVRADLALSVLFQDQGALALSLALDASEDAEQWRGPRDAATAGAQYVTFTVLMATSDFDESSRYYVSKLRWLTTDDPSTLDPDLAAVRVALLELIGGETRT